MEFLGSFLRCHLVGKTVVASPNVSCFLRLENNWPIAAWHVPSNDPRNNYLRDASGLPLPFLFLNRHIVMKYLFKNIITYFRDWPVVDRVCPILPSSNLQMKKSRLTTLFKNTGTLKLKSHLHDYIFRYCQSKLWSQATNLKTQKHTKRIEIHKSKAMTF